MRYRILASFQGAQYEAGVGPDESDVVLFAACPPPEELRFEPATGHWRKRVSRDQVQTLHESRPVGMFRGERCIVLDDLSDRLHIVYLGHDALRAAQLGYWEVDRGVFELITPRHEVTDIVEQRRPLHGTAGGNGATYSPADSQPIRYAGGGHDEFATGPLPFDARVFDARTSLDAVRSSFSHNLPITGRPRSEPSVPRPADQSEVAIPPVPEPPLPLEAEALRAASSAARRGQKSSQSRQAQDAKVTRRPQPAAEPPARLPQPAAPAHVAAGPVPAPGTQVEAAAPAQMSIPEMEVQDLAPEVSQPPPAPAPPAPAPAAAMLSKAAMLSHAAALAARQAGTSSRQFDLPTSPTAPPGESMTHSEQESQPRAGAGLAQDRATAHRRNEEPENPGPHDRPPLRAEPDSPSAEHALLAPDAALAPEPAALAPEPAALAPEPAALAPEPAPLAPEPAAPAPELASLAPEQVGLPAMPEAAAPVGLAAATGTHVDRPATEQVAASGSADALAHGPIGPEQDALSDMRTGVPGPLSAPIAMDPPAMVSPAADYLSVPAPDPLAPPSPGQDGPTSPIQDRQLPPEPAEAETAQAAEPATPAQAAQAEQASDHADGAAGTPLAGISDPPNVARPPSASAVPSWTPQGPLQPQPGFDAAQTVQPPYDIAPSQPAYYAPYLPSEPGPPNGIASANGAAAATDFGLAGPMPITPTPPVPQEAPLQPVNERREPAAEAEADPGTTTRRRRSTKRRLPTQKIFSDLATQAAIPAAAYAIGEEVDGAMCLVRTDEGFEVFNAAAGARHEVRVFQDEESAYFYLFGVLVAESVRTGALVPRD